MTRENLIERLEMLEGKRVAVFVGNHIIVGSKLRHSKRNDNEYSIGSSKIYLKDIKKIGVNGITGMNEIYADGIYWRA